MTKTGNIYIVIVTRADTQVRPYGVIIDSFAFSP